MEIDQILFLAGDVVRLGSIKIRCREIALRLGAACLYNVADERDVPAGYRAYICVKPDFGAAGAERLAEKFPVIWDILDDKPPRGMLAYLASTRKCADHFRELGHIHVIPHYHCNFEGVPSCGDPRRVSYIGGAHWYPPELAGVDHRSYFVDRWAREPVARAYAETGISLNLRNLSGEYETFLTHANHIKPVLQLHVQLNSGMKLINCLGFGLPSICSREPAYEEIAPHCTHFSDLAELPEALATLQQDVERYRTLRAACLELAPAFAVTEIVNMYRQFIRKL